MSKLLINGKRLSKKLKELQRKATIMNSTKLNGHNV